MGVQENRKFLKELKEMIAVYLKRCDEETMPFVCNLQSTPEGYNKVEQFVVNACIKQKIRVGEAIIQMERIYNPNLIND